MSRPNGVSDERFDEAGFEVPFAGSFEGEALSESEATFSAESESPFSESPFETDLWSQAEAEEAEAEEAEQEAEAGADWEAEGAYEDEAESYDESEREGEAEAALSESEWGEVESETEEEAAEREAQEAEDFVGRFDAFGDERDAEWALGEDELSFEDEGPLAGSGLSTAEQKAVEITSLFETGKRGGFYGLSGNFDDQGLSFGLVNWNIGTGSLQPLLRDFAREQPARWALVFGPHAPAFLMVITPESKAAKKIQLKFAVEQMNTSSVVRGKSRWSIKEPWVTYFKRLSEDREFQQIQVRYVRNLLKRADYFCQYFQLKSEMAFAYMFDAVSSHGKWWLTKKFKGREKRRIEIEKKLAALTAQHGDGHTPEADILLAIADVLSATSAARWAAHVRRRKLWFVTGEHPRAKELRGLEPRADVPYATGGATFEGEEPEAESTGEHEYAGYESASDERAYEARKPAKTSRGSRRRLFPPTRAALGRMTEEREFKPLTPQQKRWPCDATPPTCMTPAVSAGEFGVALQRFTDERCVNSKVPILLKKSATFMARVTTLDKKYVSLDGGICRSTSDDWRTVWAPDANGVLTKGPFPGRRVLSMLYSFSGSLFLPSNAVDNGYDYDLIVIKLPDGIGPNGKPHSSGSASSADVLVQWISAIAHETVHAHAFVTATGTPPATIPLRVAAAIAEEAATRALEAKILSEIAATADGAFLRGAVKGVAGSTDTFRVQRGFFPGEDRVTYLEHFVLTERMLDAIRRAKLKPTDIERIDKEVDAIDLTLRPLDKNLTDPFPIYYDPGVPAGTASSGGISSKALFKTIATDYGKFRFWKRVMAARWQALETRLGRTPGPTDPVREKVAQEHVKAFFGGLVRYDALPASTSKAKARELESLSADSVAEESEDVVHRSRRLPDSGGGGAAAASLDPGNFRQFADTNRLDLEIAHVLNVLDHYPEGSWAKQSASFAHHELVANNLLALVKSSNSRRAAEQIPAALRATEVPRVELNASGLGPNLLAVTVADIGAPNTFSGYILVEDDLVRNGTQPGPGRKKLALTLVHELSHIRNRVQTKKDIPAMRRDLDTFVRPGDADAGVGAAEFFEEMVAKHIEWRVLKDIEQKWDGKPIPTGPKPRGLFQFALMMPLTGEDMSPARTTYLTRLVTSVTPREYDRQVGLWLRLIANQALFHDSPTINDTVRRQFLDEFNLAQPDFRNPGVNPDGGVFFGRPTASENESDEALFAAESEMANDAQVILGKWTVRLKDWVWEYEFSTGGTVTWRDTRSSEKGVGRWAVSPKAINITWSNSATTESWARPLTPARQRGWYKSTYYTGGYQPQKVGAGARGGPSTPVPAWADAIDPFPASVTVGLDRSNASMTTAFAPVTTSSSNHLCAALADVTGGGASAPFAALRENEMVFVGSLLKIGVLYAAFALRARVQAFADAAKANGVITAGDLFSLIKRAWTPKLKALFPERPTQSFGNNQDVTVPQVDRIFTLSSTGKIGFAIASPAITVADLDRAGEFGAPIGLFHEWMRLMMRWSNNTAASRCVLALGYFYINGLFARSGFFDAGKGLWISGDYAGHDWVRTTTERSANAAGVALEPRWATAQKRPKSNFVGNALQVGRLMTAMAQDKLVDAGSCAEMRKLANQLSGGIGSYAGSALTAVGRRPSALSSKIGFGDDSFSHDCAIVERTVGGKRLRYLAVVLGSAPAQHRRDLSDLFVSLDTVVVARNP